MTTPPCPGWHSQLLESSVEFHVHSIERVQAGPVLDVSAGKKGRTISTGVRGPTVGSRVSQMQAWPSIMVKPLSPGPSSCWQESCHLPVEALWEIGCLVGLLMAMWHCMYPPYPRLQIPLYLPASPDSSSPYLGVPKDKGQALSFPVIAPEEDTNDTE